MANNLTTSSVFRVWRRLWGVILPISLAAACLFAFIGYSNSPAQATSPFTNCPTSGEDFAPVAIPAGIVFPHPAGYFDPEAGDELAVIRPVGGTCASLAPGVCGGSAVFPGDSTATALAMYPDDQATGEDDGMHEGDPICWRVWDASEDKVYTATVTYRSGFPYNSSGLFTINGIYQLLSLTPTALELTSFQAGSSPVWVRMEALFAGGLVLTGAALALFRRRRRPSNI